MPDDADRIRELVDWLTTATKRAEDATSALARCHHCRLVQLPAVAVGANGETLSTPVPVGPMNDHELVDALICNSTCQDHCMFDRKDVYAEVMRRLSLSSAGTR
jgi:hypothetical protein